MLETLPCIDDCSSIAQKAARILSRRAVPGVTDHDDLVQDAWEGVLTAQRSFDESKYVEFGAWAYFKATGRIRDRQISLTHARTERELSFVPLDVPRNSDDDSPVHEHADPQADDPLECVELSETAALVDTALNRLTVRERAAITMLYYQEMSQRAIAEHMRISQSRAAQIIAAAQQKIKDYIQAVASNRVCPRCMAPCTTRFITGVCTRCYNEQRARAEGRKKMRRLHICPQCDTAPYKRGEWAGGMCKTCYGARRNRAKAAERLRPIIELIKGADLSALTVGQRRTVTAFYLDGDSLETIAQREGLSVSMARHHRADALKVLKGERSQRLTRWVLPKDADLSVLTEEQRQLVEAYYIQERKAKDIATELGVSEQAVADRARRARARLTANAGA